MSTQNTQDNHPILVIPAYQPGTNLVGLVDELLRLVPTTVVVVNDGSSADKAPIFDELRARPSVVVLTHAVNRGKGAALKTAFKYVLTQLNTASGVVTVDADGQHLPKDAARVAAELRAEPRSLVLGARTFSITGDIPLRSRLGNILTVWVFQLATGSRIRDTQTGLRGIPTEFLRTLLDGSNGYDYEMDMLVQAARRHVPVREIEISTVYEPGNPTSHFNPLRDSFRIYFVLFRSMLSSLLVAGTDLLIFSLLFYLSGRMLMSLVAARACGAAVGFVLSKRFVFQSRGNPFGELIRFTLLWLTLLGLSYGLMLMLTNSLGLNPYGSRILVDSALFFLSFIVQKRLIFYKRQPAAAGCRELEPGKSGGVAQA